MMKTTQKEKNISVMKILEKQTVNNKMWMSQDEGIATTKQKIIKPNTATTSKVTWEKQKRETIMFTLWIIIMML